MLHKVAVLALSLSYYRLKRMLKDRRGQPPPRVFSYPTDPALNKGPLTSPVGGPLRTKGRYQHDYQVTVWLSDCYRFGCEVAD